MTATAVLDMLFGAALVAIGVLAAALADRLRGLRVSRDRAPRVVAPIRTPIEVVEPEAVPAARSERPRAPKIESKASSAADDVIAALVAAGYKKPIAAEAAWACSVAERATIEGWTYAALRRCARGGLS